MAISTNAFTVANQSLFDKLALKLGFIVDKVEIQTYFA